MVHGLSLATITHKTPFEQVSTTCDDHPGLEKNRLFEANDLSERRIKIRKSPLSEGQEHHVKNDDEIDESHKSCN